MLTPRKPSALLLETLVICILATPFLQGRGKLDVIHLTNGDTITGESAKCSEISLVAPRGFEPLFPA